MRLLWDNALRRSEVTAVVNIEDFQSDKLWIIRKGKIQKIAIDLALKTRSALARRPGKGF